MIIYSPSYLINDPQLYWGSVTIEGRNLAYYSRQLLTLGLEVQERIFSLKVLVAGCGALGSTLVEELARLGVGDITVVDPDLVEEPNLHRTHLFTERDVGRPKAEVCSERAREINPDVRVTPVLDVVDNSNAEELIKGKDFVFDALDNVNSRLILNDACVKKGVPLIYGGVSGEYGSAMIVVPKATPCLSCFMQPSEGEDTCETVGTTPLTVTLVATVQAQLMLEALRGQVREGLIYLDSRRLSLDNVKILRNPSCEACSREEFMYLKGLRIRCGIVRTDESPPPGSPKPFVRRGKEGLLICYDKCFKKVGR